MAAAQAWSSRFGFLMASVGFAVGLGNIWRFPYVAGENGGSAFVLVYLACVFGIGVPILMAEVLLGRRGGGSPPFSISTLAERSALRASWGWVGSLNLVTAYMILIVYTVVIGWVLYYLFTSIAVGFTGVDSVISTNTFNELLAAPAQLLGWTVLALVLTGGIVYAGVQGGIEPAVRVLMPTLFLLMVGLALYNTFTGGMGQALSYLFTPDFAKVNTTVLLAAVGQAFFSIGVAMAGMMVFGAYLPRDVSIGQSAVLIAFADTLVALVAGLVIFPMVFHHGLDPAGGAGLVFQTLPVAFAQMHAVVAILFFLLLSVGGVTSAVGLFEPLVAWAMERFGFSRQRSVVLLALAVAAGSVVSVFSYNLWQDVVVAGVPLATALDFVPNQIFLPLGGLLIAVFVGWRMPRSESADELRLSGPMHGLWFTGLRYVVVPAVAVILIGGLFT